MNRYVILLRGVMPTGKNKVPMAPLREALEKAGLQNVRTYIQSGNALAVSELRQLEIESLVHETIAREFGGDIAVMARTREQFMAILDNSPFAKIDHSVKTAQPQRFYFSLLQQVPPPDLLQKFQSLDFQPEQVCSKSGIIYTHYATKYSDSKINNMFYEQMLKIPITTRNYNTMSKLAELSEYESPS
jgi:uncharacterized protein (DUF1697 family)